MRTLPFAVLRGVCQTPAYVACETGLFRDEGLDVRLHVEATAWLIPHRIAIGEAAFAVLPWTRVAQSERGDVPLVVVAGSGTEEAAIVVRRGLVPAEVRTVVLPREGGMKDLTALALLDSLGWSSVEILRQPSGDGAILSLIGEGADAASMIEPYATLMSDLGIGTVVRRTGDVWPGAPGCSLATTRRLAASDPQLVEAVVRAYVRGARRVQESPDEAAAIASRYIGVAPAIIRRALAMNRPDVGAIRNHAAIAKVLALMVRHGYLEREPEGCVDTAFLDRVEAQLGGASTAG